MVYSKIESVKRITFFKKVKIKFGKILAQYFPLNKVRIWGLRICGFSVGKKVYIGPDLIIASLLNDDTCYLEIGDRVAIGPRVTIILSSDANWSKLSEIFIPIRGKIIIKNDSWLGAGSIILPNIIINEMSLIGAGAVVTKDVPSFTVVAGVPAKEIYKIHQN